jgi:hypothetical protein
MLWAVLAPSPALAQDRTPPAEITQVRFGWDDTLPAERWAPVWVDIRSGPTAFEGVLTLEYTQDGTQRTQVIVPVATTPGATVPYELAACVPQWTQQIVVRLEGRRYRQELRYSRTPSSDTLLLPSIDVSERRILLVGEGLSATAMTPRDRAIRPQPDPAVPIYQPPSAPPDAWTTTAVIPVATADLPLGWMLYEGVTLVVARERALQTADPRAFNALMTWVEAGGRLIVQLEPAGDAWGAFVGRGHVDVAPARPVTPRIGAAWGERPGLAPRAADPATQPEAQGSLTGRTIRVTQAGRREGWKPIWTFEGAASDEGLGAAGPVGMGLVALLGIDPARLPEQLDAQRTGAIWRILADDLAPGYLSRVQQETSWGWYGMSRSGADSLAQQSIAVSLDRIAIAPAVGDESFIAIAVAVFGLGALLGPIDFLVLRRGRRARWHWLTATTWIALASGGAYLAPILLRSGESIAGRYRVLDVLQTGDDRTALAWETALAGTFAGKPLAARAPEREGSWWRGVSPVYASASGQSNAFPPLDLVLRSGSTRGTSPGPIAQGQWTFRTLLEQSPGREVRLPIDVQLTRRGPGCSITVGPMPDGASVRVAGLLLADGWRGLDLRPAEDAQGRRVQTADLRLGTPPTPITDASDPESASIIDLEWGLGPQGSLEAQNLPLVRDRYDAIRWRLAAGWACVVLEVQGLDDPGRLDVPGATPISVTVLRVLVPPVHEGQDGGDEP